MLSTVIFDMDGLLIDSEPLWKESGQEVFKKFGIVLTDAQYVSTTGLRTKEFVRHWMGANGITDMALYAEAETAILDTICQKVAEKGKLMSGVQYILNFFKDSGFKIGLASSSSMRLINQVLDTYQLGAYFDEKTSAENLLHGKPHPQVYLNCALALDSEPTTCICFEDSFNGMIAAKAARMKCVIVPEYATYKAEKWAAADLKISSLQNFNGLHIASMNRF